VNAPEVYQSFVDISGQSEPTLGDRTRTVATAFGGDNAAFTAVNPLDVLVHRRFPDTAGMIVVGREDAVYRPQAQLVERVTRQSAMRIEYREIPGGHSWHVWAPGLQSALPWLGARLNLTTP
jgi:S-formylglutathione hydrolase FrmB